MPLTVQVVEENGTGLAAIKVGFSVTGDGVLSAVTATTGADGNAQRRARPAEC